MSASAAFIIRWNTEGAFFSPNGILRYSHFPFGVMNERRFGYRVVMHWYLVVPSH